MYQSVFIWKNFNKCTKLDNSLNFSLVHLSNFGYCYNFLNPVESCLNSFGILAENIHISVSVNLFNNNCGTCCTLYFLNHLTSGTNKSADKLFRNSKHLYSWSMRLKFSTWF